MPEAKPAPFAATEFRRQAADATVLRHWSPAGANDWTHAALWSAAGRCSRLLQDRTGPGELVLIVSRTSTLAVACFLGGIGAGRTVSIFPPQHPIQEAEEFRRQQAAAVARIDPRLIVVFEEQVRDDLLAIAPDLASRLLLIRASDASAGIEAGWEVDAHCFSERVEGRIMPNVPLFVQHGSGTTGVKKAVAVFAAQLANQFEVYWRGSIVRSITAEPRVASWLPLYHDMGLVAACLLPLIGGAPISLLDPFDWVACPQLLFDMIETDGATLCWMPNFAFRHYVRLHRFLVRRDLSTVRAWVNCSEPCRSADAEDFEAAFSGWGVHAGVVVGCFAMAEAVFALTSGVPGERRSLPLPRGGLALGARLAPARAVHGPAEGDRARREGVHSILSSGRPLADVEVDIYVDGRRAEDGVYGEIGVRAGFLFDGYRDRTRQQSGFRGDGTFMTGDLGVILDQHLFVLGRSKEVIIIGGRNLYAGDLEAALAGIPGIKRGRIVAFGVANANTGTEDLVIVAERDVEHAACGERLTARISELLQAIFLVKPHDVRIVNGRWLVKTTSGKLSRDANRRKYESELFQS
ncbi:MAG: AMP-binding protein [Alphaproteobacteria bacterium]